MGFLKNMYVLTLVICVIIINDHKSDANYCIKQLTETGGIDINLDGPEAFEYVYLHLVASDQRFQNKYILDHYLKYLFENASLENVPEWHLSPKEWKEKDYPNSSFKKFFGRYDNIVLAKYYAYFFITEEYFQDTTNIYIDDLNQGYYYYMYDILMSSIANSNAVGPSMFCNDYTVSKCIQQINYFVIPGYMPNVKDAFLRIYLNFTWNDTGIKHDIVRQYIEDLFDLTIPQCIEIILNNPKNWCNSNYNYETCDRLLQDSIFAGIDKSLEALRKAYLWMKKSDFTDEFSRNYYLYIYNTISYIDFTNAQDPIEFCNKSF